MEEGRFKRARSLLLSQLRECKAKGRLTRRLDGWSMRTEEVGGRRQEAGSRKQEAGERGCGWRDGKDVRISSLNTKKRRFSAEPNAHRTHTSMILNANLLLCNLKVRCSCNSGHECLKLIRMRNTQIGDKSASELSACLAAVDLDLTYFRGSYEDAVFSVVLACC